MLAVVSWAVRRGELPRKRRDITLGGCELPLQRGDLCGQRRISRGKRAVRGVQTGDLVVQRAGCSRNSGIDVGLVERSGVGVAERNRSTVVRDTRDNTRGVAGGALVNRDGADGDVGPRGPIGLP